MVVRRVAVVSCKSYSAGSAPRPGREEPIPSDPGILARTIPRAAYTPFCYDTGTDAAAFTTQTLTFPAGSAQPQTFTVTPTDDAASEGPETLVFALQNVQGGNQSAAGPVDTLTVTIVDDETYTIAQGEQGATLRAALAAQYEPATLGYDVARDVLYGDILGGTLEGIYTGLTITLDPNADPSANADAQGFSAEHVLPQSKGAGDEPARSNLHNLFPSYQVVNAARGNDPFDEIPDADTDTWYRLDQTSNTIPQTDIDEYSERDGSHPNANYTGRFEPRESKKGDIARALLYFYTIYQSEVDAADANFFNVQRDVLLQWHQQDPVDAAERASRLIRREGRRAGSRRAFGQRVRRPRLASGFRRVVLSTTEARASLGRSMSLAHHLLAVSEGRWFNAANR